MYLIVIAWMYVVLMMSIAEATNSNGTLLGALITFVLYGAAPESRALHIAAANPDTAPANPSVAPDASGHAPGGAEAVAQDASIAPVRKEP